METATEETRYRCKKCGAPITGIDCFIGGGICSDCFKNMVEASKRRVAK